ncbi:MAG: ribose-5-phosphate isomerase A, partial [Pseudohongiellaceae bacterium]
MNQDAMKKAVARAAFEHVRARLQHDSVIGVGTGSTANFFIDELAALKDEIQATVASSEDSARRLKAHGIPVVDLNSVGVVDIYVDGADEINPQGHMIKG